MKAGARSICASVALRAVPRRYRGKDSVFWAVTLGSVDQTADQLPDPGAKICGQPESTGKNGGHTLNLHHFARNGVVLLGRLIDVHGDSIVLAPDLRENLAFADKGSDDFKNNVDTFVRERGMDVPAPSRTRSTRSVLMQAKMLPRLLISGLLVSQA